MRAYRMLIAWETSYVCQPIYNRKDLNFKFNDIWMSD
ncbi:hypothetical protein PS903_05391 [Pseudomonas fluorescens]|nr:hypothetical protein PS903_05391 [Pseudomonas fluorescens]